MNNHDMWVERARALLRGGSVHAMDCLAIAADQLVKEHREYVVMNHPGPMTVDDLTIIDHWIKVRDCYKETATKLRSI